MKDLKVKTKVMAKWPGSALWFPAVITELRDDGESYEVMFEDGTEEELPETHVVRESTFRRARSRSRSPSRRSRSPSRRSPARRKSKSPGRKPLASKKAPSSPGRKASKSPSRTQSKDTLIRTTPTRTQTKSIGQVENTSQAVSRRSTVSRTESHIYSTRSATRSGAQTLEPAVEVRTGKVPKTTDYEYGGPIGAFFVMVFFPLLVLYLYFACRKDTCQLTYKLSIISLDWHDYYDCTAYEIFLGFIVLQTFLAMLPIGRELRGQPLRTGQRLKYRLNGFFAAIVSIAIFVTMIYYKCGVEVLYSKFLPLASCAMLFAFLTSVVLYVAARRAPRYALSPDGNSGNIFYDFFMGHELNPRPFQGLDLKLLFFRITLIGWTLINISFVVEAWKDFPNNPPYPLLCVVFFQAIPALDTLLFEETVLTTMGVHREGLGFVSTFACFVLIPFTYSLQGRYLVDHAPSTMPQYCLIPIILLNVAGFVIYRQSNLIKNRFRRHPTGKDVVHLESIPTSTGKRLLVSGWWGFVRKPNYLGDLMMALSWSLFCGFDSIIPYYYPVLLIFMLIDREIKDSKYCKNKYGGGWEHYCKRVPYRIIPYIY